MDISCLLAVDECNNAQLNYYYFSFCFRLQGLHHVCPSRGRLFLELLLLILLIIPMIVIIAIDAVAVVDCH